MTIPEDVVIGIGVWSPSVPSSLGTLMVTESPAQWLGSRFKEIENSTSSNAVTSDEPSEVLREVLTSPGEISWGVHDEVDSLLSAAAVATLLSDDDSASATAAVLLLD